MTNTTLRTLGHISVRFMPPNVRKTFASGGWWPFVSHQSTRCMPSSLAVSLAADSQLILGFSIMCPRVASGWLASQLILKALPAEVEQSTPHLRHSKCQASCFLLLKRKRPMAEEGSMYSLYFLNEPGCNCGCTYALCERHALARHACHSLMVAFWFW